ncbi:MAG: PEP-CTERM sorting domain-containing protein [Phycisphaerae bacterium]|nr:PEP-CTERM sorting domain-containing protein [Phycisphaerae bacterium]
MRTISLAVAAVLFLAVVMPAHAIVYYNGSTDNTTAPTEDYAGSGWQWQGDWGPGSGTAISSKHFITVKHYGWTFDSNSAFTLNGVTYHYSSHEDDPNSDLRIVTIQETFSSWAPLYTGSDELGERSVIFGRGETRGDEVKVGEELKGWEWSDTDGTRRWGTNKISAVTDNGGTMLTAKFNTNALDGVNEATLAKWDSGGGWFIKDGDTWKLSGVSYSASGPFDLDSDHTSGVFYAALFDKGGLYEKVGSDPDVWEYVTEASFNKMSSLYATRISSQTTWIDNTIPEPGTMTLLTLGAIGLFVRRRRR